MELHQGEPTMRCRLSREKAPWSDPPKDLLELISKKLTDISDYVRFRAVCTSWRSATDPTDLSPQVPWLMLPYGPESPTRSFLSLTSKKVYTFDFPEIQGKVMLGSSHGWMVILDVGASSAFLFNPLTRAQIHLPPTTHLLGELGFRVYRVGENTRIHIEEDGVDMDWSLFASRCHSYIRNAYLSSSPISADCVVAAILYETPKLAFSRPGDDQWTVLDTNLPHNIGAVSYHKQQLYIIDFKGNMVIIDASPSSKPSLIPSLKLSIIGPISLLNVADSSGQLLLVAMGIRREFTVFKLDQLNWSKVEGIGENALFFSPRHCSSIPASNLAGGVAGCIYFRYLRLGYMLHKSEISNKTYTLVKNYEIFRYMIPCEGFVKDADLSTLILRLWKHPLAYLVQPEWFTPALN